MSWYIASIMSPLNTPIGGIWGGAGSNVGSQSLYTPLADENAGYVVSLGEAGCLTLAPISSSNNIVLLQINGADQLQVSNGLNVVLGDDNQASIQANGGWNTYPLMHQAMDIGPVVQLVMWLVSGSQFWWESWDADPVALLYQAGLPESAMDNLGDTVSAAPTGNDQFAAWLKTVQFSSVSSVSDEAWASWLSCALCKGLVVGSAAATFILVTAACIAAGPAGLATAAAAIAQFDAIATIATATGLGVNTVAAAAAAAFFSAGAAAFVGSVLDSICQAMGSCSGGFVAPAGLPARHPLRPIREPIVQS